MNPCFEVWISIRTGTGRSITRWIWNLCDELFPKAIQIVDIYHVKEKLRDLGKLLHGNDSDLARRWSEERIRQLKAGELEKLVEVLQGESSRNDSVNKVIGYCQRNANGCATHRSAIRDCASPARSWKPDARTPLVPDSSEAACTGPPEAQTRWQLSVVASRAIATMTSGIAKWSAPEIYLK